MIRFHDWVVWYVVLFCISLKVLKIIISWFSEIKMIVFWYTFTRSSSVAPKVNKCSSCFFHCSHFLMQYENFLMSTMSNAFLPHFTLWGWQMNWSVLDCGCSARCVCRHSCALHQRWSAGNMRRRSTRKPTYMPVSLIWRSDFSPPTTKNLFLEPAKKSVASVEFNGLKRFRWACELYFSCVFL